MSTAERLDVSDIVGDLDLPCEAKRHFGNAPATWVVWQNPCCDARPRIGLSCDECLRRFLIRNTTVRCHDCGHRDLPRNWIRRFERINKPGTPP